MCATAGILRSRIGRTELTSEMGICRCNSGLGIVMYDDRNGSCGRFGVRWLRKVSGVMDGEIGR